MLNVSTIGLTACHAGSGPETSAVTSPRSADAALPEIGIRR